MIDRLRRAAAHVLVDDVDLPVLDEASAHHLFRVLRVADGDEITVTDGAGRWRACRATDGAVVPVSEVEMVPPPVDPLVLAVAIPKQDRPEWLVQKATELGVDRVLFLHAERSVVRWDAARALRHLAKLRKVAVEASLQSRRVWVPTVDGPVAALDVLGSAVVAEPGGRPMTPADRFVAIGPEGGWSDHELSAARDSVSLGPHVLRVETAALAACALAAYDSA